MYTHTYTYTKNIPNCFKFKKLKKAKLVNLTKNKISMMFIYK